MKEQRRYIGPPAIPRNPLGAPNRNFKPEMVAGLIRQECYKHGIKDTDRVTRIYRAVSGKCTNQKRLEKAVADYIAKGAKTKDVDNARSEQM